jgi:hypothetical protein
MKIEKSIASKEEMRKANVAVPYSGTEKEKQLLMSILRSKGITDQNEAKLIHEHLIESKTLNDTSSIVMFITNNYKELKNG